MKNSLYENCNLCPRNCGVNRFEKTGFCGETSEIKIACGTLHFGVCVFCAHGDRCDCSGVIICYFDFKFLRSYASGLF